MISIESRQNAALRHLARLGREKKYRHATGEMVGEGEKLLEEAYRSGAHIKTVLLREDIAAKTGIISGDVEEKDGVSRNSLYSNLVKNHVAFYVANAQLFASASDVETPQGVLFSCESPVLPDALPPVRTAMLLDGVQDPGNIGTILRTAEAFGLDALILCEGCADPTAPKVVRATMGAVFRQRLYRLPLRTAAEALRAQGLPLYAAALREDSIPVPAVSLRRSAVIVGSEGHGVSAAALELCDKPIIIPMAGRAESLNAGVAASLLLWEMTKNG